MKRVYELGDYKLADKVLHDFDKLNAFINITKA
jgi:hypothetical protein